MEKYNSFEKQPPQESLKDFQKEIQKLKNPEIEKKQRGEVFEPHLVNIEVNELTLDDMMAWQNYKKLTAENITQKDIQDFNRYRDLTYSDKELTRKTFSEFLANKLTILWGEKQLKEIGK